MELRKYSELDRAEQMVFDGLKDKLDFKVKLAINLPEDYTPRAELLIEIKSLNDQMVQLLLPGRGRRF